ncbi:ferritin-like domain-containing protein [Nocardioides mesophilus]|uniref:Ferritin-like domain-containing protein n=1 Tax=Nocardioides mesophilus TaxID=433659 RepID=A0A7G9R9C6_9ACTN|nr:ferritin-like domain-containing protein [Nocardioides mesophilus]QNN52201.1 ferritin-like domain-containing protein [Nocardioides mesophilus]
MTPIQALQQALAGEHAAIYVYGVLGGRVSSTSEPVLADALRAAYATHRARRDQLLTIIRDRGEEPVAAEPSYEVPTPARTAEQCRVAARQIEDRCAESYAVAVGNTARADRQWAIDALEDAAVRGLGFGAGPDAFPGVPEL